MPLRNIQLVLKKVLPEKTFNVLYDKACNAYDVYQHILNRTLWIPQLLYYVAKDDENNIIKTLSVQKVLGHTMVSKVGVEQTFDISYKALDLEGDFVECGVARGGCSALMALIAKNEGKNRKMWMFDSYEGLPQQSDKDGKQKPIRHKDRKYNDLATGYCLGTYNEVENWIFGKLKLNRHNVFMIKGWFQDTLPQYKEMINKIAVLRLDGDWYESTKCCLENLYNNVVKDGYVIIDDYQLSGCKLAVDEFLDKLNPVPSMQYDKNGRAYFRKL